MRTFFGVAALALVAAACGTDDETPLPSGCRSASAGAPITAITIRDNQFVPSCAKVTSGVEITFTNTGFNVHTVTTDTGQPETFDSGALAPGQVFTHAFAAAGTTVHVHCNFHPGMLATILVE